MSDVDTGCEHELNRNPERTISDENCERAAGIFRALGDTNRLRLLFLLAEREMCVSELTQLLNDNVPAVSQRLKHLKSERLVKHRRDGKHIIYRLADQHILHLIENGLEHASEH